VANYWRPANGRTGPAEMNDEGRAGGLDRGGSGGKYGGSEGDEVGEIGGGGAKAKFQGLYRGCTMSGVVDPELVVELLGRSGRRIRRYWSKVTNTKKGSRGWARGGRV